MSLIPILADVIFSPFDLAWYYAGRYWPVLLLIAAVIVITRHSHPQVAEKVKIPPPFGRGILYSVHRIAVSVILELVVAEMGGLPFLYPVGKL